jgi:hypothetical protein
MNSTYFNLLAEFQAGEIRLVDCCDKYFSLSPAEAKRRASFQKLPVPVYRATESQKGEWLLSLQDLAAHLDAQKGAAREHFKAMQAASSGSLVAG